MKTIKISCCKKCPLFEMEYGSFECTHPDGPGDSLNKMNYSYDLGQSVHSDCPLLKESLMLDIASDVRKFGVEGRPAIDV